ncbi:response regulator transcription factor [bacterium]|nr:response regulator transcription factor [bacterium]
MADNLYFVDDEEIVLVLKKSDIIQFFNGKSNISASVHRSVKAITNTKQTGLNRLNGKSNTKLTSRQLEVLKYIVEGKNNLKIAKELCVSRHTIKAHVANILHKLDVDDRYQAAIKAINEKIV